MRIPLIAAFLLLAVVPAMADPRGDTLAGISRCNAIADNRNFLNCIYGAVQPLRAQLQLPPAPEAQTRLVPPALGSAPPPRPAPPTSQSRVRRESEFAGGMRERIDNFHFGRGGFFNLMLENGEMYRQDPNDAPRAKWVGRGSDYVVYVIKEGPRNAVMKVAGDPNIYRMQKVN
ncbi:MAG: hypothetical protein V4601_02255 [Pseudomonadota bacterium]